MKKAWLLLVTYLMVVLFSNSSSQLFPDTDIQTPKHSHTHESYEGVHHEHTFHVGIFHYLGHIYETIISSDFDSDDHVAIVNKLAKNEKNYSVDIDYYTSSWINVLVQSSVHFLANPPPVDWSIPTNFHCPHLPLRAPPTVA